MTRQRPYYRVIAAGSAEHLEKQLNALQAEGYRVLNTATMADDMGGPLPLVILRRRKKKAGEYPSN